MELGQFVERGNETAIVIDKSIDQTEVRLVLPDGSFSDWVAASEWKATRMPMLFSAWLVPFLNALQARRTSVC